MKKLKFEKINNDWFVCFKFWPFAHRHLQMVAGSDDLLDFIEGNYDKNAIQEINFSLNFEENENSINLIRTKYTIFGGAFYTINYGKNVLRKSGYKPNKLWLCPVTLFALGHYPKYISINLAYN